ncbi:MAG: hypothetical protein LKE40_12165 [Spirochaetia bacterium]|jgi:transposase-like protein|nr:hypothetical protein [Spirochaetia bacterium]
MVAFSEGCCTRSIKLWLRQYEEHGAGGLKPKLREGAHDRQFKTDAVRQAWDGKHTINGTARQLGISKPMLYTSQIPGAFISMNRTTL